MAFIFFSGFIAWAKTPSAVLNGRCEREHTCLVSNLMETLSLPIKLNVNFRYVVGALYQLEVFLYSCFSESFYHE